ncbi:cell division protein ZapA [candidate division WOR-3 bacterium]|nr:cell division protein ZapA [candidate division WOR-3 bacterium]
MNEDIIEALIDGKKISFKVSEDLDLAKTAIETVRRELEEVKKNSGAPISREDAFLLTALNIAGMLIKEKNFSLSKEPELNPELLEKIDKALS